MYRALIYVHLFMERKSSSVSSCKNHCCACAVWKRFARSMSSFRVLQNLSPGCTFVLTHVPLPFSKLAPSVQPQLDQFYRRFTFHTEEQRAPVLEAFEEDPLLVGFLIASAQRPYRSFLLLSRSVVEAFVSGIELWQLILGSFHLRFVGP